MTDAPRKPPPRWPGTRLRPDAPAAPPAAPGEPPAPPAEKPKPPVWPLVIGIISTALGGLTFLCGLLGAIGTFAFQALWGTISAGFPPGFPTTAPSSMPATAPATGPATQPAAPMWDPFKFYEPFMRYLPFQTALTVLGLVLALLLVIAGILLLRRRRIGARLHVVYAALAVVEAVAKVVLAYLMSSAMADAMAEAAPIPRMMQRMMAAQSRWQAVVVGITSLAYPVFLLIWFCRRTIRRQVRSWPPPRPDGP
jgi:hypothetical protein